MGVRHENWTKCLIGYSRRIFLLSDRLLILSDGRLALPTSSLEALREKRDQLTASLAHIDDLRPGFLTARFRKCGKPNCHCAEKGSPGHGPSYSLTHRIDGKTVTQVIPQGVLVERTKAQLAEYRRFRQLVRDLITVSEQICSAQLREAQTEARAKKPLRRSAGRGRGARD